MSEKFGDRSKAQSAMEYLMTYGWAILITAVVLTVLFELGIFGTSSLLPSSCVAVSGFGCTNMALGTSGLMTATVGSIAPITITATNCSASAGPPTYFVTTDPSVDLTSGGIATLDFYCPLTSNVLGTTFSGNLWIQYNTATSTGLTTKIATVITRSTTASSGTIPSGGEGTTTIASSLPQYVAQFNGATSEVGVPDTSSLDPTSVTISCWVEDINAERNQDTFAEKTTGTNAGPWMSYGISFYNYADYPSFSYTPSIIGQQWLSSPNGMGINQWFFIVGTWDQNTGARLYVDGVSVGQTSQTGGLTNQPGSLVFGLYPGQSWGFNGLLSDCQVYNKALSGANVVTLYMEGIGGAPIIPGNVVGWWPFDGNTNDYSGYHNNGAPSSLTYNSAWQGDYTPP